MFVCLFICCFFNFNHLRIPPGIFPESFVKIGLDLAEKIGSWDRCEICDKEEEEEAGEEDKLKY